MKNLRALIAFPFEVATMIFMSLTMLFAFCALLILTAGVKR